MSCNICEKEMKLIYGYDNRSYSIREDEEYFGETVLTEVVTGSCRHDYYCENCNMIESYYFNSFTEEDFCYIVDENDKAELKSFIIEAALNWYCNNDEPDFAIELSVIEAACNKNNIDFDTLLCLFNSRNMVGELACHHNLFDYHNQRIDTLSSKVEELRLKYEPDIEYHDIEDDDIPF